MPSVDCIVVTCSTKFDQMRGISPLKMGWELSAERISCVCSFVSQLFSHYFAFVLFCCCYNWLFLLWHASLPQVIHMITFLSLSFRLTWLLGLSLKRYLISNRNELQWGNIKKNLKIQKQGWDMFVIVLGVLLVSITTVGKWFCFFFSSY